MYVTDTHPLIWYTLQEYKRLSRKVKSIFDQALVDQRIALVVPTAVLWELSLNIKADPGNIQLAVPYKGFLTRLFQIPTVIEGPITKEIVAVSQDLHFHNDPFDTLIVATAIEKDLPLITNDSIMHQTSPCKLIWE